MEEPAENAMEEPADDEDMKDEHVKPEMDRPSPERGANEEPSEEAHPEGEASEEPSEEATAKPKRGSAVKAKPAAKTKQMGPPPTAAKTAAKTARKATPATPPKPNPPFHRGLAAFFNTPRRDETDTETVPGTPREVADDMKTCEAKDTTQGPSTTSETQIPSTPIGSGPPIPGTPIGTSEIPIPETKTGVAFPQPKKEKTTLCLSNNAREPNSRLVRCVDCNRLLEVRQEEIVKWRMHKKKAADQQEVGYCPCCRTTKSTMGRKLGSWPCASFQQLTDDQKANFYEKCVQGNTNEKIESLINFLAIKRIEFEKSLVVSKWLPLEVWARKGHDPEKIVRNSTEVRTNSMNETTYSVSVEVEMEGKLRQEVRNEVYNMIEKQDKKYKKYKKGKQVGVGALAVADESLAALDLQESEVQDHRF